LTKNFILEQLIVKFKEEKFFKRESLLAFYRQFDPDLKESTFRWRLHQLKARKIITPVTKDLLTLNSKPGFRPVSGELESKVSNLIERQFPGLKYCIWSTKSVNEFMRHLPGTFISILQVEKDALEPVYEYLKSQHKGAVYLQPDEKVINRYIFEAELPIILQSLISKAPTQKVGTIASITIEKMIVDLFCEKSLFVAYQGSELVHIINNVYQRYAVNFTKLLHYARRRGRELDLKHFLKEKTDIPKVIFNDKN
jgi:hypothetical protein